MLGGAGADHEGCGDQEAVQALVEVGVLQAMLGDQGEDAVQGQHAHEAPDLQRLVQEVRQQQRVRHVRNDLGVHPHQNLTAT